jgi:hypothetical protein
VCRRSRADSKPTGQRLTPLRRRRYEVPDKVGTVAYKTARLGNSGDGGCYAGRRKVGIASLAGTNWDVWVGNIGWTVISYIRQQTTNSIEVDLAEFANDAVLRGQVQNSWYLASVQFGFEPW